MFTAFTILIIFCCILLSMVVLIQNPKGGGMGSGFAGGSSTAMGSVKETNDILVKATWALGIGLFVLCILANATLPSSTDATQPNATDTKTKIEDFAK